MYTEYRTLVITPQIGVKKELVLHPEITVEEKNGIVKITIGNININIPSSFSPYLTSKKVFPKEDGKLYKMQTARGKDFEALILTHPISIFGFGFFEIIS